MANIKSSIKDVLYQTTVRTATNTLISDEPETLGGGDTGFSPDELLAAALGACTCATLRMYADRKGWKELLSVEAEVTFTRDPETRLSSMVRSIRLTGDLQQEQVERLLAIANKCPVHNTLTQSVAIQTELIK